MKRTRKISSFAAALVCGVLLICSTAAAAFAEAPAAAEIPGTYRAEYDIMKMIGAEMEEAGMKLEGEIPVAFTIELKDDDTFTLEMQAEEFVETMQTIFKEQGPDMIRAMLEEEGVTEEAFAEMADEFGVESYDEFINSLVDEMVQGIADEMAGSLDEEFTVTGTYEVAGADITFTADEKETATSSSASEAAESVSGSSAESVSGSSAEAGGSVFENQTATFDEEGAIHMEIPYEEETLELIFKKQ